jgi:hypothetical protein
MHQFYWLTLALWLVCALTLHTSYLAAAKYIGETVFVEDNAHCCVTCE